MTHVVRDASFLPSWFSLESYAAQEELSLAGWLRQFSTRAELRRSPPGCWTQDLDVRTLPILIAGESEVNPWMRQLDSHVEGRPWADLPVRPMVLRDLVQAQADVGSNILEEAGAHANMAYLAVDEFASPTAGNGKLVVDLSMPDDVLISAFRDALPTLREVVCGRPGGPVPSNVKLDPAAWIRFAVLPYLDLKQWSLETGSRVTNRVLADAIFPRGDGGEEVARKTTAKLADEVTSEAFLRRLLVAAALEIRNS